MGRWIVIILATVLTVAAMLTAFPSLHHIAFNVGSYGVKWFMLVGCGVAYIYHRFTE